MVATSHASAGESEQRTRPAVVTDQGGLVLGRMIPTWARGQSSVAGRHEERSGTDLAPLTSAAIATAVEIAARAPSVHNTQPWRFQAVGGVIELRADPDRRLAQIDPDARELMISCGAALFGLRLGLRQVGRVPVVHLWPDPAQPWLLARVWPAEHATVNTVEAELLAAVPHRHTHRGPFTPGEVSVRLLEALAVDAAAEGAELRFIEPPGLVSELAILVDQAAADQDASAATSEETRHWLRPIGSDAHDGVPERATASESDAAAPHRFRQREFGASGGAVGRVGGDIEPGSGSGQGTGDLATEPPAPPATAALVTAADTANDWLRAGQALNRLLLRATRWVFASLQSQPLELPHHREQVRDLLSIEGQPQMLLQFGRSNTALATPRRRQTEFRTNQRQV
jgi:Nitroreductase family